MMTTKLKQNTDPDMEAILERALHGKPLDPNVYKRIREEGARSQRDPKEAWTVDIAVI